jgi:hypothetical protein
LGRHEPDCGSVWLPEKVVVNEQREIVKVVVGDQKFKNEADFPTNVFQSPQLKGFSGGRALIARADKTKTWHRYAPGVERMLYGSNLQSTPKQNTRPKIRTPNVTPILRGQPHDYHPRHLEYENSDDEYADYDDEYDDRDYDTDDEFDDGYRRDPPKRGNRRRNRAQQEGGILNRMNRNPVPDGQQTQDELNTTMGDITLGTMSQSFQVANTNAQLINDIPRFDGNPSNFAIWKAKVELVRPGFPEDQFVRIIKGKLGPEAYQYTMGLAPNRVNNYDGLIKALDRNYNIYSDTRYATQQFNNLKQNGMDLTKFHAQIYVLLKGMGRPLTTRSNIVTSRYIDALDNAGIREDLLRLQAHRPCSLEQLMNRAADNAFIKKMARSSSAQPVQVCSVHETTDKNDSDNEEVCAFKAKPKGKQGQKRKQNNASVSENKYCTIHETSKHALEECKGLDGTKCYYCKAEFPKGEAAAHSRACPADRCYNCQRRGHKAQDCRVAKRKATKRTEEGAGGAGQQPAQPQQVNQTQNRVVAAVDTVVQTEAVATGATE